MTLPELPEPSGYMTPAGLRGMLRDESTCLVRKHPYLIDDPQAMFTADQMRSYGEACAKAERERCAQLCENLTLDHPGRADLTATQCAAAIRGQK